MAESSTFTDCELEYIEEGYDPLFAAEICANAEARRSHKEAEKPSKDQSWEYGLGWTLGSMNRKVLEQDRLSTRGETYFIIASLRKEGQGAKNFHTGSQVAF